jgi:endopeptidase La
MIIDNINLTNTEIKHNNMNIRLDSQLLKNEYKKYTKYIIKYESHIDKLYNNWVIDINTRNLIFQKLSSLIKLMTKNYKEYQTSILSNITDIANDDLNYIKSEKFDSKNHFNNKLLKSISDNISFIKQLESNNVFVNNDTFHNNNIYFPDIADGLIQLSERYGINNMNTYLEIYFNNKNIKYILDYDQKEKFKFYNKIFVPHEIKIFECKKILFDETFIIKKKESNYDSLISNTCKITLYLTSINIKIVYVGYIINDKLNLYVRTSPICNKFIFEKKVDAIQIIKKKNPVISDYFLKKYSKLFPNTVFLLDTPENIADDIINDHETYCSTINKNFNVIIKEFINSDIYMMHKIIMIFLLGDTSNINTAGLLFNLLKDKKVEGENIAEIIYNNLSYYAQAKLKKTMNTIKSEMIRIKTLTVDNITMDKRLAALTNMPDEVKAYILEKLNESSNNENNYKLQTAINGLIQFPWKPKVCINEYNHISGSLDKSRNYIKNVARKINDTVYGHENGKRMLLELVGKWMRNPESTGQVIGLVGPPGVGKTLLAKSISSALNIPLSIIGLGGISDAADLIGHSFTYSGAQYGMIIRQMIRAGSWRCVMFFDEVDKVSKRNDTNEIYNTLIHITDPNMNKHFQDRFYSSSIEFDLSGVLIVFSYNDSTKLDPVLLDRIHEIRVSAYSMHEKISIAQKYIMDELCTNIGFKRNKIIITDETIKYIIEQYTCEAGVRSLRRKLEQILLKINLDRIYLTGPFKEIIQTKLNNTNNVQNTTIIKHDYIDFNQYVVPKHNDMEDLIDQDSLNKIFDMNMDYTLIITEELIRSYLEKPLLTVEKIHKNNLVGVINGLYATTLGIGGIVPIQILKNYIGNNSQNNKKLELKITGNQKHVMKESVICAMTVAVNILNDKIKKQIINNFPNGFHIHAADGGTSKDGPSAGCAFTTAFVSIILNKKINNKIAMTGEIELTGKISKIGGLDAKLQGAKKAGINRVYISKDNYDDYVDIKKKHPELFADNNFIVITVEHIIEIVTDTNIIENVSYDEFDFNLLETYVIKQNT